jgi:thioredoxin reductase (NADPH)
MDLNLTNYEPQDSEKEQIQTRVLVIGSGPAGLAAALYAARADLNPIVLTGMEHGGQVSLTHIVENYPGFPEGVGGNQLVELFQKQAERFGAKMVFDTAMEVDLSTRPFRVNTFNSIYECETLIITTGATPRHLNIPGEVEFTGKGVSYCGTCDGWFFKEKDIFVVGGGDSAIEEGLFLTRYVNSVTVVHRRDELRAGQILQNRAFGTEKLKFKWDTVMEEILGDETVNAARLKNVKTGAEEIAPIDGVFIFIGHIPNTELFEGKLDMDANGYLKVDNWMRTSVQGVFAAGEVADSHFRQVITSAGMGAAAAIQANHFIEEHS